MGLRDGGLRAHAQGPHGFRAGHRLRLAGEAARYVLRRHVHQAVGLSGAVSCERVAIIVITHQ